MTIPTPSWLQWGVACLLVVQFWMAMAVLWKIVGKFLGFLANHLAPLTQAVHEISARVEKCPGPRDEPTEREEGKEGGPT